MSVDIWGTSWDQCRSMVQYSFPSTEPEGSLGRTAQDDHLNSHTAPELCCFFCFQNPMCMKTQQWCMKVLLPIRIPLIWIIIVWAFLFSQLCFGMCFFLFLFFFLLQTLLCWGNPMQFDMVLKSKFQPTLSFSVVKHDCGISKDKTLKY